MIHINNELREYLASIDEDIILWDGFDDAIIGIGGRCGMDYVAIYNKDTMIEIMIEQQGCSLEEAIEYIDFNIVEAYVGERTPIIVDSIIF